MTLKKTGLPVLAALVAFFIVSCDSEKNENDEKNESTETELSKEKENTATSVVAMPSGEIPLDKLPGGIKEFVDKNFAGYTIIKAASDPLCQGGDAIDVAVTKSGSPNLSLIFKTDGSYVQQEEDVAITTAPEKIRDVIATKYADYKPGNQIEKLILADKSVQYLVDLSKGTSTKEVIFNMNGDVVCEK